MTRVVGLSWSLAFGVVVSIAIALGAALVVTPTVRGPWYYDEDLDVQWTREQVWGATMMHARCPSPWLSNSSQAAAQYEEATFGRWRMWSSKRPLPRGAVTARAAAEGKFDSYRDHVGDCAFGWPARWLSFGWTHDPSSTSISIEGGFALRWGPACHVGGTSKVVPLRVDPVLALASIVFWSVMGCGIMAAGRSIRQCVRRMNDRCARCGYLLRGLPGAICPECGGVVGNDLN